VSSSPCAKHMPLLLLLLLLLHLLLLLPVILLLLFRDAVRHFLRRTAALAGMHFSLPLRGWLASVHAAPLWAAWRAS
jgi:hypothetical protein